MALPYSITTTNNNKCPHGFPVGTCPICNGMAGGSSKDKNKPRKPGEMSYNECMAEWKKMQALENAKMEEKIQNHRDFLAKLFSNDKNLINLDKILKVQNKINQIVEKLPDIVKTPLKSALNIIFKTVNIIFRAINNIPVFIINIQTSLKNFINSISEKLPMVLYEIKNFSEFVLKTALKPIKSILNLFISKEKNNEKEKDERKRRFKKILKKLFNIEENENEDIKH